VPGTSWFIIPYNPFGDFNRELGRPGTNPSFPEGVVGIRCDDDFWQLAALPWTFHSLSLPEIVSVLWPDTPDPEYLPDHEEEE
jgi:hypothetical protein